jgi:hypothetical protein
MPGSTVQILALSALVLASVSATYTIPLKRHPKTKSQFLKMKAWRENINYQIQIGAAPEVPVKVSGLQVQ